jgi:hypothetical protein
MTRTITQIAASASRLYVLCDDGAMFRFGEQEWLAIPPIPQGQVAFKKRQKRSERVTNPDSDQ